LKFIGIKYLYGAFLPAWSDWFSITKIYLNMNHSMWKRF
jgi:hypothetical protein